MFIPFRDHNPSRRRPYVTWMLIAANCLVFLIMWPISEDPRALAVIHADYALIPQWIVNGYGWGGLLTSMFLHGGLLHLGGNMLYLFILGDNLEDRLGHLPFALFYLACGLAAGIVQILSDPNSTIPVIGASGAVAGVMGGYLLLYPRARIDVLCIILVFVKVVSISAWIVLGLWFVIQLMGAFNPAGLVAYWAHLGGFAAGVIALLPLRWQRGSSASGGVRARRVAVTEPPPVATAFPTVVRQKRMSKTRRD